MLFELNQINKIYATTNKLAKNINKITVASFAAIGLSSEALGIILINIANHDNGLGFIQLVEYIMAGFLITFGTAFLIVSTVILTLKADYFNLQKIGT